MDDNERLYMVSIEMPVGDETLRLGQAPERARTRCCGSPADGPRQDHHRAGGLIPRSANLLCGTLVLRGKEHKMTTSIGSPEGFQDLVESSYAVRREIEETGYQVRTSYEPTDWAGTSAAEQREFWGGFNPANGTCPKCWMLRSADGSCNCTDARHVLPADEVES